MLKKEKEVARKNTWLIIVRTIFWIMLVFIFIKGVISCFKVDKTTEVTKMIDDFKTEYAQNEDTTEECFSFAQNFIKEYLTVSVDGEKDFLQRISKYASKNVLETKDIYDFKTGMKPLYVKAYRQEEYSKNQADVYVLAEVEYTVLTEDESENTKTFKEKITLKVPVYHNDSCYCIEDIPIVCNDSMLASKYSAEEFLNDNEIQNTKKLQESLTNFFAAYYTQDQNVISYYLNPKTADSSKFLSLNNQFTLEEIESLRAFETDTNKIKCIVSLRIKSTVSGLSVLQEFNLDVTKDTNKFYIDEINTKTVNLK